MTPGPRSPGSAFRVIEEMILRSGPVPFDRFMSVALYHPTCGYYRRGRAADGGRSTVAPGDYVTAPRISPLFGRLIGRLLAKAAGIIPGSGPLAILEIGAGEGSLAAAAAQELAGPLVKGEAFWILSDLTSGPAVPSRPEGVLRVAADGVAPYRRLPRAIVLANELFDALPCRLFRCRDGVFREVLVGLEEGRLVETLGDAAPPAVEAYIASLGLPAAEGAAIEVSTRGRELVGELAGLVAHGLLVAIDYGGTGEEIAARAARGGTLRTFAGHSVMGEPLEAPGAADLTFDVDFTELARWGEEAGWDSIYQGRQGDFLLALGLLEELILLSREARSSPQLEQYLASKRLLLDEGLGGRFRVLIMGRGLSVSPSRAGELLGLLEGEERP